MGVNTTYIGHTEIQPPLNAAERDYLHAFSDSRRSWRRSGPYAVTPQDPHTGNSNAAVDRYNRVAQGQPSLWCQWEPCSRGLTATGPDALGRLVARPAERKLC